MSRADMLVASELVKTFAEATHAGPWRIVQIMGREIHLTQHPDYDTQTAARIRRQRSDSQEYCVADGEKCLPHKIVGGKSVGEPAANPPVGGLPHSAYRDARARRRPKDSRCISEQMIGRVGRNEGGRLAVIVRFARETGRWTGLGFDRRPWASWNPVVIADSVEEYVERRKLRVAMRCMDIFGPKAGKAEAPHA